MSTRPTVAVLATLDTKGPEAQYLREQIEALGGSALLVDMGVVGRPQARPDITREQVAEAGGTPLSELLRQPTRQTASPVMIAGATKLLLERLEGRRLDAVLGLGGTQGTSNCALVMQALPYGLPKLLVSTVASGDTSAFVGIKDITMMFSVGDLLGLNRFTRKILANAAGAVVGMAKVPVALDVAPESARGEPPLVGMTNLGVLTEGALVALEAFREAGCEVIVFHAVGSGGRAMEQMMKDGLIGAVFDYALGEISDELWGGLRAGGPERLTVAGRLGLPQVLCPGGAEHVGLLVEANTVPERWRGRPHVFHNPIILAPRLDADEMVKLAQEIGRRLAGTRGRAALFMPLRGTSRYAVPGGPLHDQAGDKTFVEALRRALPPTVELVERDCGAEDPAFVREAVARLVALMKQPAAGGARPASRA
ncbi:MAG TPA: Tm-1-like ATP-binding domain-containing protein [Planctomycetota bacterium]|nr:Tm-1-like ATP-binding domain-containing protein [Planctomycetota bacterium]